MERALALIETFQSDLRSLSAEARKKHPHIKEVSITNQIRVNLLLLCKNNTFWSYNYKNFNILQSAEKALLSLRLVEEQKDLEPEKYAEGKFIYVGPFSDHFLDCTKT